MTELGSHASAATPVGGVRALASWTVSSDVVVLGAIGLLLLTLKLNFNPFPYSDKTNYVDGAYYYQVAAHVARGDGLVTGVSLYNNGFKELPHAVTFYPLWPLVLGVAGRAVGMLAAAKALPELLYFCALGLLYCLANRVASAFGPTASVLVPFPIRLNVGHAAVLIFGLNHVFFRFTSLPFTEGLAYTLAFALLLVIAETAVRPNDWRLSIACGVLAGLAYLVRAQFIVLVLVAPLCFALVAWSGKRAYRRAALLSLCGGAAIVLAWTVYLILSLNHFRLAVLVDAAAAHETEGLDVFRSLVPTSSVREAIAVAAGGLKMAFSYQGQFSYVRSFSVLTYLVPLAVVYAASRPVRLRAAWKMAGDPAAVPVVASVVTAAMALAPIHIAPFIRGAWSFHFRQGLPYVLALLVAIPYLASRHVALRLVVIACLAAFLAASVSRLERVFAEGYPEPNVALRQLADWIVEQPSPPMFISRRGSTLGAATNARVHYIYCEQSANDVLIFFKVLNVDYLITYKNDTNCGFFRALNESLVPVRAFGEGEAQLTAWRWRRRR